MERNPMEMALSTDIVMDKVLSHLNATDLLSYRLVSKFWNKTASLVLRRRSMMIKDISEEEQLMELEKCINQSSDLPFAGLTFNQPWLMYSDRAIEFFQNYGSRFTRLCLDTDWEHKLHDLAPFIHLLPRLSILEVGREGSVPPREQLLNFVEHNNGTILKLPSVRTIRIAPNPKIHEDVLREVVTAASPSLQIECLNASPQIIQVLKNIGKLRAVSCIRFDEDVRGENYELKMDPLPSSELPMLTKLNFSAYGCFSFDGLMEILLSSQHTLKELHFNDMMISYDYEWDKFPVLSKLTAISLNVDFGYDDGVYLFKGPNGHKFPALKQVSFNIESDENQEDLWSDGLFIVPTVTSIDFSGYVSADGMEQLAQSFPNVIDVGIKYRYFTNGEAFGNPSSNPFEIWSVGEFEHLEKLRIWDFRVKWPTENYINMDQFLTGIPATICEKLQNHKLVGHQLINCPFRKVFNDVIRENQSIVQLSNLKELIVCMDLEQGLQDLPDDPPFISMVSVWYALKMIPHLRVKFMYNSPLSLDQEQTKVLEAAFKDVQDYIKLEPFFY